MLVVIEGPDGAGKTTLIEKLRENSKRYFAILRASGPPRYPNGQISFNAGLPYMQAAVEFSRSVTFPVICDRFHAVSDPVYGRVIRGDEEFAFSRIEHALRYVNLIVYCRPILTTILRGVASNEQMDGVIQKTEAIVNEYDVLMAQLRRSAKPLIIDYDYETDSIEGVKNAIFPE